MSSDEPAARDERASPRDGTRSGELTATELQARAARNLTWAREMLFVSQADAARGLGQNTVTYNRYEMGLRKLPMELLMKLCGPEFRLTLDYFFRSDLTSVSRQLALRLAAEHPVLLDECLPPDKLPAPGDHSAAAGNRPPGATRTPGTAKAPAS
jgi:transcriptional regulator with XRE-family HTH domain